MARKHYSQQFKRDAIRLVTDEGYSLAKAAAAIGVSQTTLVNWKKTLEPAEQANMAEELRKLRAENRQLRMERDILKKAATFFAKENQ